MMWHGDWSGADWVLMSVGMLVFWTVVVVGIVWVVRSTGAGPRAPRGSALDILDERYARGDISDEEYQHRRANLASR